MKKQSRQERIPGYLYALDGLRAISLLFIVMYHTWQQSWIYYSYRLPGADKNLFDFGTFQRYGYVAVDAFFVLSGFCLFYPIARSMFGESKFSGWKQFFIKRARRLYPSYVLLLIVLLIFPKFSYGCDLRNINEVIKQYVSHLLYIHTWNTKTLGTLIPTSWTMGIEVQFYILFPLICIPFRKKPILSFIGISLISFAIRLWMICFSEKIGMIAIASPLIYLDVFGCGMIAAYFVVYVRNNMADIMIKLKPFMTLISALCLFAAVCYIYWLAHSDYPDGYAKDVYFRFMYRIVFAALMAGFIFTACFSYDFWEKKIWGNRVFVFISSISYTVYLWHINIYLFLKAINFPHSDMKPVMNDKPAMAKMTIICLVSVTLIGWIITNFIEAPIIKYGYRGRFEKITGKERLKPVEVKKRNRKTKKKHK